MAVGTLHHLCGCKCEHKESMHCCLPTDRAWSASRKSATQSHGGLGTSPHLQLTNLSTTHAVCSELSVILGNSPKTNSLFG